MYKSHHILKIFSINFFLFLLIILSIEGAVRYFFPQINAVGEDGSLIDNNKYGETYGYKQNAEAYSFGSKIITDSNGFRINPKLSMDKSKKNLLILGDSVSMGVGVDSDKTFPSRLFSNLRTVNVINSSVTGYTFFDYLNILPKIIDDSYTGIIISLCLNDFDRISQKNIIANRNLDEETDKKNRYPNFFVRTLRNINDNYFNFNNFLRCHFRTYLLLKSLITDSSKDHFLADMLRYNDYYNTKEIIRDQFVQLLYFQKNHKLRLLIFIFPYEYQLRTGVQENLFPQEMIAQATKDLGLNIIDLYNPIKKYLLDNDIKSQDLFIFNDPCHFSSEGHKIIADIILNEIKEEGIE